VPLDGPDNPVGKRYDPLRGRSGQCECIGIGEVLDLAPDLATATAVATLRLYSQYG
jgi:hypothetical protein